MNNYDNMTEDELMLVQAFSDAAALKNELLNSDLAGELRDLEERYQIGALLGEGLVKRVYEAHDSMMNRKVAFATMKDDNQVLLNDFLNEARLSSALEHPFIAPVYDMGFQAGGSPYFVMKLYEGCSLCQELDMRRVRPVSIEEQVSWTLNIFLNVCKAVFYAHSQGVLHLDIKPANIRIDGYGGVQLCDWGIARYIADAVCVDPGVNRSELETTIVGHATLMGEVHGTPGYMAPEQITKDRCCNEQTDVYGLGALLYHMIQGEPPLDAKDLDEVDFPDEIKSICMKALSDDASERYQAVDLLINDINKYRAGLVTIAENAGLWQIMAKWISRNKKMFAIAGANVSALCIGLAVYINTIQESETRLKALVYELNTERQTKEEERIAQAEQYYQQAKRAFSSGSTRFDFDPRDIALAHEMAARALELDPTMKSCWGLLGQVKIQIGQYQSAVEAFKRAGEKYMNYIEHFSRFIEETPEEETRNQQLLRLISAAHSVRNVQLRNHIIFRRIQFVKTKEEEFEFGVEATRIISDLPQMKWNYDDVTGTLDLSGNRVKHLPALRRMRLQRLILRGNNCKGIELHNIRWMGIKYLDLSFGRLTHLDDLTVLYITPY